MSHKGSWNRVEDHDSYGENFDAIFYKVESIRIEFSGNDYIAYNVRNGIYKTAATEEEAVAAVEEEFKARKIKCKFKYNKKGTI